MADDSLVQQAEMLLQQARGQSGTAVPKPANQTFGPGTVVGVQPGDPFSSFFIVPFFDGQDLHVFNFGGQLPSNVVSGAVLTLEVAPPVVAGGYSSLVSAKAAQLPTQ